MLQEAKNQNTGQGVETFTLFSRPKHRVPSAKWMSQPPVSCAMIASASAMNQHTLKVMELQNTAGKNMQLL